MQVEILGMPLPWRSIFSCQDSTDRSSECNVINQKEIDPFLSRTDTNPFAGAMINNKETPPVQVDTSTNLVDLLTGERIPESISQSVTGTLVHEGSDLLDFLDDAATQPVVHGNKESKIIPSHGPLDSGVQEYIKCFQLIAGPQWVRFYVDYWYIMSNYHLLIPCTVKFLLFFENHVT